MRGQVDRGTGVLHNAAYVGRLEWNRCSYVRDPSTRKRVARPNPRDEWEEKLVPELRIVDEALWHRVKARQREVRTEMARDESGQALNRAHRAKHLLSGLIFCGECGAPFAMRDARRYGCRNFRSRGTCGNDALVDRYDLERVVAAGLQERWLTVANLEALRAQVEARYAEQTAGAGEARAKLIAKAARVEGKMARVVSAIADARHSAPLLAKLADLEAESKRLALEIEEADTSAPPLVLSTAELEEAVRNFTTHIEGVFDSPAANAALLRETVRGMIDKIVVTPRPNGSPLFTIEGESIGLLRATGLLGDAGPQTQKNPGGGGFRGFGVGGCGGRI